MVPWMKGGGEDRKLRFCIGAKICSGKTKTEEEAQQVCLLPKDPKEIKPRKTRGKAPDYHCLAHCLVPSITVEITEQEIYQIISNCDCASKPVNSNPSYRRFMNACLKEQGGNPFAGKTPAACDSPCHRF